VVSDIDLAVACAGGAPQSSARELARTELITVEADDSLAHAAQLMSEHECPHLLVVEPQGGRPIGVLSALDLAGVLAWGSAA
jgi:CBS domain-containing protein